MEHIAGGTDPAGMPVGEATSGLCVWDGLGSVDSRQAGKYVSLLQGAAMP